MDWTSTWEVQGVHGDIDIVVATVDEDSGRKRTFAEMQRVACLLAREDGRIGEITSAQPKLS